MKLMLLFLMVTTFVGLTSIQSHTQEEPTIKVLEVRDYILQPGKRSEFHTFFQRSIAPQQAALGAKMVPPFSLKDSADNFVWFRGFIDMASRSQFMKDFYYGEYWKTIRGETNRMLVDSYNVNLMKPVTIRNQEMDTTSGFSIQQLNPNGRVCVSEYFIAKTDRSELLRFLINDYVPHLSKAGMTSSSSWICESANNDYKPQHVYQEKKLVLLITFYNTEQEYLLAKERSSYSMSNMLQNKLNNLVAKRHLQVLHPL